MILQMALKLPKPYSRELRLVSSFTAPPSNRIYLFSFHPCNTSTILSSSEGTLEYSNARIKCARKIYGQRGIAGRTMNGVSIPYESISSTLSFALEHQTLQPTAVQRSHMKRIHSIFNDDMKEATVILDTMQNGTRLCVA